MYKEIKYASLLVFFISINLFSEVEEIIVSSKTIDSISEWEINVSSSSISSEEINLIQAQHPKQIFTRLPGIWISRGSGQEHLTSIRSPVLTGPGACGSFLILEDGIPVRPSGFCNVNGLFETQTESALALEVIRGPASAKYGSNAMHGVINVVSEPIADLNSISSNIGPNYYQNFRSSIGNSDNWRINSFFSSYGGFREESGYDQQKFHLKNELNLFNSEAIFNLRITNINQETAGYIYGKDVYKSKDLSKENNNPEAYRDAYSIKSNLRLSWSKTDSFITLIPYLRKTEMEFLQHYLPGTPIENNSHSSIGYLSSYSRNTNRIEITAGMQTEFAKVNLKELQENTLTNSSSFNNAVRPKGLHYDYQVDSKMWALFFGFNNLSLGSDYMVFGDFRLENNFYSYDNKMISGNTREDGSICSFGGCFYSRPEDRSDSFTESSFRIGVNREFGDFVVFSQISLGFRPPQMTELYRLQKKQIVGNIDSEKLLMLEIGAKLENKFLKGSANLYSGKKRNSIFRDSQNFMQDDGKTSHKGVEISLQIKFNDTNSLFLAGTMQKHQYDFYSLTSMMEIINSGNLVDTSPKTLINIRWSSEYVLNIKSELELEYMGSYFTDAANAHKYGGHTLLNYRLSKDYNNGFRQFLRIHNLLNKDYAERADFNAFGGDRYFPGIPRQIFLGLEYSF